MGSDSQSREARDSRGGVPVFVDDVVVTGPERGIIQANFEEDRLTWDDDHRERVRILEEEAAASYAEAQVTPERPHPRARAVEEQRAERLAAARRDPAHVTPRELRSAPTPYDVVVRVATGAAASRRPLGLRSRGGHRHARLALCRCPRA